MQNIIDINADVGEGINNEAQLIPLVSSCNIACGGHAGDEETMQTVVKLAKQHHVKIGAHPSYPDKENFGRVIVDMPFNDLVESLKNQIEILIKIINEENLKLHHIKPHGALYNYAAINTEAATAVVEVMKQLSIKVKLYAPYKSVLADLAIKNNIEVVFEAFVDRNYNPDLTLVSRNQENAVIKDEKLVFNHVYKMFTQQKVLTIKNTETPIKAQTFCVHGDNPKAIQLIKYLVIQLKSKGIFIS
ncbi:5-oxoprolinase subunit PxpA [Neotamlana laminarinivorans]|uniref:5-oxoprolinase subunit PxpA n=1 Tax=Neotamlana laminarinivorans TaxID=2883124 RepID=A0A9X1HXY5_9FLAO|nr:5-oxoprolinase subunit PxpA [Tamlana laminarinivorans]MCB4797315.1 5-oxoprolinase subunit PxpA [Tamlana laminarinivorans]